MIRLRLTPISNSAVASVLYIDLKNYLIFSGWDLNFPAFSQNPEGNDKSYGFAYIHTRKKKKRGRRLVCFKF